MQVIMVLCKDYNGPARVHKSGCNPTSCVPIWLFSIVADLEVSLTSVEITFPHYGQFNLEIIYIFVKLECNLIGHNSFLRN